MKTKVDDLSNEQLNKLTAKACKWCQVSEFYLVDEDGNAVLDGVRNEPTTNDAQAMWLVKEFGVEIEPTKFDENGNVTEWVATTWIDVTSYKFTSSDLNHAICKAVVASVFGDEVEVGK